MSEVQHCLLLHSGYVRGCVLANIGYKNSAVFIKSIVVSSNHFQGRLPVSGNCQATRSKMRPLLDCAKAHTHFCVLCIISFYWLFGEH